MNDDSTPKIESTLLNENEIKDLIKILTGIFNKLLDGKDRVEIPISELSISHIMPVIAKAKVRLMLTKEGIGIDLSNFVGGMITVERL